MINKFFSKFNSLKSSLQRGSGNIYVIAILGTIVAGSAVMVGGVVPQLEPPAEDAQAVQIDTNISPSAENNALELRSFGILTPTLLPSSSPTPAPIQCFDKAAVAIVVDVSGSMIDPDGGSQPRIERLKDALRVFLTYFQDDSALSLITFSGGSNVLVPFGKLSQNQTVLNAAIDNLTSGGSTNMRSGLASAYSQLKNAKTTFTNYNQYTVFFTDGVPESGICKYRQYSSTQPYEGSGPYNYFVDDVPPPLPAFCYLDGTTTQPTFFNHPNSPVARADQIKEELGAKIFSISMYVKPVTTDPDYAFDNDKYKKTVSLLKNVSSDPDTTYYIDKPTSENLSDAYRDIAAKICPTP